MTVNLMPNLITDTKLMAELHALSLPRPWAAVSFAKLCAEQGVVALASSPTSPNAPHDGFILLRLVADEAEILTLAIRPESRRQGLGRALIRDALAHSRQNGIKTLHLEVAADNTPAQRLYQACGFTQTGKRQAYYAGIDAILMQIALD